MIRLQLCTVARRPDGCFGVLLFPEGPHYDPRPFAVTCERTFEFLRTVVKGGVFLCKRTRYHKGGYETFEIIVPGHSRVLFHRGSFELNSEGCILVAESFAATAHWQTFISDSRGGFDEFMRLLDGVDEFELEVTNRPET